MKFLKLKKAHYVEREDIWREFNNIKRNFNRFEKLLKNNDFSQDSYNLLQLLSEIREKTDYIDLYFKLGGSK